MDPFLKRSGEVFNQIAGIVSGCNYDPRRDMHFVDPKSIPAHNWQSRPGAEAYSVTDNFSSICPYCNRDVNIQLKSFETIKTLGSVAAKGVCPPCGESKTIRVFLIGVQLKQNGNKPCNQIWFEPVPKIRSLITDGLSTSDDAQAIRVWKAYRNAIDAFNSGKWEQSLVSCGRVVEGIGKTKFPNASSTQQIGRLFKKLKQEISDKPDTKEVLTPLLSLGEALRVGRNPGGHFDLEGDPDRDLADKVIDLTEFLIKYVYLIANETENVNELIENLNPADKDETETDHSSSTSES